MKRVEKWAAVAGTCLLLAAPAISLGPHGPNALLSADKLALALWCIGAIALSLGAHLHLRGHQAAGLGLLWSSAAGFWWLVLVAQLPDLPTLLGAVVGRASYPVPSEGYVVSASILLGLSLALVAALAGGFRLLAQIQQSTITRGS